MSMSIGSLANKGKAEPVSDADDALRVNLNTLVSAFSILMSGLLQMEEEEQNHSPTSCATDAESSSSPSPSPSPLASSSSKCRRHWILGDVLSNDDGAMHHRPADLGVVARCVAKLVMRYHNVSCDMAAGTACRDAELYNVVDELQSRMLGKYLTFVDADADGDGDDHKRVRLEILLGRGDDGETSQSFEFDVHRFWGCRVPYLSLCERGDMDVQGVSVYALHPDPFYIWRRFRCAEEILEEKALARRREYWRQRRRDTLTRTGMGHTNDTAVSRAPTDVRLRQT